MKNILLIGSGAREHAIAKALSKNKTINITCLASHYNPGILDLAKHIITIDLCNIEKIINIAKQYDFDFAIIGPEAPLEAGIVDRLASINIPSIGPTKSLARIETSKSFCRQLMSKNNSEVLPAYEIFKSITGVEQYLATLNNQYVIKANGLTGGKGVYVAGEHFKADFEAINICKKIFSYGHDVLIEEKLVGEEFSLLSFCDGKTLVHMPLVQDHKRAYENDLGPNTGGMGSVSYADHSLPFLNEEELLKAKQINEAAIKELQLECGESYKGIIYGGYMLTNAGIKLIEFNARFGDPESLNLLALLETDFSEICQSIINGTLDESDIKFSKKASVCKYVVPYGYPQNPVRNEMIECSLDNDNYYLGHIEQQNKKLIMLGSRAIAVLGVAKDIKTAEVKAEVMARSVTGDVFYRKDIGTEKLISKKINYVRKMRA